MKPVSIHEQVSSRSSSRKVAKASSWEVSDVDVATGQKVRDFSFTDELTALATKDIRLKSFTDELTALATKDIRLKSEGFRDKRKSETDSRSYISNKKRK